MKVIFLLAMLPLACEGGAETCTTPDVTNAEKEPNVMTINAGNGITYTCIEGYVLGGGNNAYVGSSVTLNCLSAEQLSGALPECIAVTCNTPDVTNAEKDSDVIMISYGSTMTYTCNDGYELGAGNNGGNNANQGSSITLDCLSDGSLSGALPECIDIDECFTTQSLCGTGICENTEGSYLCHCNGTGFIGPNCQYDIDIFFESMPGQLNIMITAPNSGQYNLDDIIPSVPDRQNGCYNSATGSCFYEPNCSPQDPERCGIETLPEPFADVIVQELNGMIYTRTGFNPKLLINKVHRSRVDVDLNEDDGTFGQELALDIHRSYHDEIAAGIQGFTEPGEGIVFVVHTFQTDETSWIPLAYMLTANDLNTKSDLELEVLADSSSVIQLASRKGLGNVVRGDESLGTRMEQRGLDAVPSKANPSPNDETYFSLADSYIANNHRDDADIIGLYIPCQNGEDVKCTDKNYIKKITKAIVDFYTMNYAVDHCEVNPCDNDGVCINLLGGYLCECPKRWRGLLCNEQNFRGVRVLLLKLMFAITIPESVDFSDNAVFQEWMQMIEIQVKVKLWRRFKRPGIFRKLKVTGLRRGSLNVEINIETDDGTDAAAEAAVAISGLSQDTFIFIDVESTPSSMSVDGIYVSTTPSDESRCQLFKALIGGCPSGEVCVVKDSIPTCTKSDDNTFIYAISAVCVALVLILVAAIVFAVVMKWKSNRSMLVLPTEGPARTVYVTDKLPKMNEC